MFYEQKTYGLLLPSTPNLLCIFCLVSLLTVLETNHKVHVQNLFQ